MLTPRIPDARIRPHECDVAVAAKKTNAESMESEPNVWHVNPTGPLSDCPVRMTIPVT